MTAKENFALEQIERNGITGPAKRVEANIAWADTTTPAEIEIDVHDEVVP